MQVGGLGDVVTGLARACLERGHDVEVLLPFYECLPTDQIEGLQHDMDFDCPKARYWHLGLDATQLLRLATGVYTCARGQFALRMALQRQQIYICATHCTHGDVIAESSAHF